MMRTAARAFCCCAIVVAMGGARSAAAQAGRVAVGVGYQVVHVDEAARPLGLDVDASIRVARGAAIVAELGWSRTSSQQFGLRDTTSAVDTSAGLRWTARPGRRVAPFGQLLVGVEHERIDIERFGVDTAARRFVQPGGGVSVRVGERDALFAGIDFRHVPDRIDGVNAWRVVTGVRLQLR